MHPDEIYTLLKGDPALYTELKTERLFMNSP